MIYWNLVNAQLLPAATQKIQLEDQLRTINRKAMDSNLTKSTTRALKNEADSVRDQIVQISESANASAMLILNGFGGVMFVVCLTVLIRSSSTYKKELVNAEKALEQQLIGLLSPRSSIH